AAAVRWRPLVPGQAKTPGDFARAGGRRQRARGRLARGRARACRVAARHHRGGPGPPCGRRPTPPATAMSDPARFLSVFAQALAGMSLYTDGHPARERAIDAAYQELADLQADTPRPLFTFLGDEVVYGRLPLRELKAWDWGQRLAHAGVQRLEFEDRVSRDDFQGFLEEVLARLTLSVLDTSEARQMRRT